MGVHSTKKAGKSRCICAAGLHCRGVLSTHQRLLRQLAASVWERPLAGSNGEETWCNVVRNDHALKRRGEGGTVGRKYEEQDQFPNRRASNISVARLAPREADATGRVDVWNTAVWAARSASTLYWLRKLATLSAFDSAKNRSRKGIGKVAGNQASSGRT
jgi:hypothetical protein